MTAVAARPSTDRRVDAIRTFNRFVTRRFGVLEHGLLGTKHSLTEARVLFELAQQREIETSDLRERLGLDSGHLSRLLTRLEGAGLVARERSAADARRQTIALTGAGHEAYAVLDTRSSAQARELLDALGEADQRRLVGAMNAVRHLLTSPAPGRAVVLRAAGPGDFGWVIGANGAAYHEQFGWDERYETLVARIVADHLESRDPRREATWIAELDGRRAGCVMCVADDASTARLRLLLVESWARGLGIGNRLVEECLRFARRSGYGRMVLWTNDVLSSARPIYEAAGFELVSEKPHTRFGPEVVGQDWVLDPL